MSTTRAFGWRPQLPDFRDKKFSELSGLRPVATLPSKVDLRPQCPAVYDQGNLGSCTANAIAFVCQYEWMRQKKANPWVPSRLFIYYNERFMEGTVNYDSGAYIRDGIKSLNRYGFAPETYGDTHWAYKIKKFTQRPPQPVFDLALKEQVKVQDYAAVSQNLIEMKTALSQGYPIVIGFTVYESFMSDEVEDTGVVPMPKPNEQIEGGHAVAIVGYDDASQWFIVRNSWGSSWGKDGYFKMPYAYFTNPALASDLWVVRLVP